MSLLIVNRQSNLINIEFVLQFLLSLIIFTFLCLHVFLSFCLCVFLLVFVCIYVLSVASVLSAFVMYLAWLCFSKTIRVIHCFYLLKNPCNREKRLLGIFSLESKTYFSCN